jgi:hypothetical protein
LLITALLAIKLVFFPPNLTIKQHQPYDLGIIRSMKHYYREKIVKSMVNCVEQEIEFPSITVLDALLIKIRWRKSEPSMSSHQPFQTAFAKGVLCKILGHILLNVMMKTLCGIWGKKTSVKFVTFGRIFELALDQQRK